MATLQDLSKAVIAGKNKRVEAICKALLEEKVNPLDLSLIHISVLLLTSTPFPAALFRLPLPTTIPPAFSPCWNSYPCSRSPRLWLFFSLSSASSARRTPLPSFSLCSPPTATWIPAKSCVPVGASPKAL